jgi:hypothetical protein
MKMSKKIFALAALAALALATGALAQTDPAAPAAATTEPVTEAVAESPAAAVVETTPAAAPAVSSIVGAPPEGKGLVVFFRPSRMMGMALGFTVREGETELGRLPNGRYFAHAADPGVHEFGVGGDKLRLEIEPAETYYVQQNIAMGFVSGNGVLVPSDQATFEARPLRKWEPRS